MAENLLTDKAFRNLKPIDKEQLIKDGGGLFVRIRPITDGGAVSFRLAYRIGGKLRWATLTATTLSGARKEREIFKAQVKRGSTQAQRSGWKKNASGKSSSMNRPSLPGSKP